MRSSKFQPMVKAVLLFLSLVVPSATFSPAQAVVNITATRQTTTLPDGNTPPMWGWVCGTATGATCTAMNGQPQTAGTPAPWQPPLIVVSAASVSAGGPGFTINLSNALPVETLAGNHGTVARWRPRHTSARSDSQKSSHANRDDLDQQHSCNVHAVRARAARAIVCPGSGAKQHRSGVIHMGQPQAGDIPDLIRNLSIYPGTHGSVWRLGSDYRSVSFQFHKSLYSRPRHGLSEY